MHETMQKPGAIADFQENAKLLEDLMLSVPER
jgi:hypothetical protein